MASERPVEDTRETRNAFLESRGITVGTPVLYNRHKPPAHVADITESKRVELIGVEGSFSPFKLMRWPAL